MSETTINETLLSRQPILDQQQELVGYELSLQPADAPYTCSLHDRARAAALVCATYAELGVHRALGRNTAFLHTDPAFLHNDAIEALPPDAVVLELVLDAAPDERTVERCRTLRDRRYSLALADYNGLDERSRPLLTMLDVIKIDLRAHDEAALCNLAGPLTRLPLKLLAQGVDTQEDFERCRKIGFHLFQGHFFAHPEIVSGRRLSPSQAALIQIINLAGRDADTKKIEERIKRSLRHAITMLGRRQLQRWLQLLLMTPSGKAADTGRSPLLQVAALRGRMMELLLERCAPQQRILADQGFITGLMSMMPAALGLPMKEIFEQIDLEPEVMQALTTHSGLLGQMLALLECFDAEDMAGCTRQLAALPPPGLSPGMLNACLMDALGWVNGGEA